MREFFKLQLETLHVKTGLNQYYKLSELPDATKQIIILLDSLVLVCDMFPYIPDEAKKKIIEDSIVKDQEFTSLNSRVIWKWLNIHKDIYFKEEAHKEKEFYEPAPPEVADKYLKQMAEFLTTIGNPQKTNGMKEIRKDAGFDKGTSTGYKTDPEAIAMHLLLEQWTDDNFFEDGQKKPGYLNFDEWIKLPQKV